jgi:4-amino-4-deoxy-L-arabinose transferase-like glycosyltransferase
MPLGARRVLGAVGLATVLGWFLLGIDWGLPSRRADVFLFGPGRVPWSGTQIMELAPADGADTNRGADVDLDPILDRTKPVVLNETDRQRAEIVRRYRLFTYQPDEWNTMRSLSGMRPGEGKLDPRLYQYGGLWVYGVGAMLKAASLVRFVDLRGGAGGLVYYLDRPEAFGRFYVVARLYSALWGVVAAWAMYRLATRVMPAGGAAVAAACYALMPVVVNQAHEAKPHLAGLGLMLLAVLAACRYVETGGRRWWLAAGALCGAAFGMVVSSVIIFAILPVMPLLRRQSWAARVGLAVGAGIVGGLVYALTNPYVPYNLLFNREVLRSNLGTSTAMYHVGGSTNGFLNAVRLIAEGVSPILAALGVVGVVALLLRRRVGVAAPHVWALLAVPALIVVAQFVILGAGKPGEYGRFALLPDTVLCLAAVAGASHWASGPGARRVVLGLGVLTPGFFGATYVARFLADARDPTSRLALAEHLNGLPSFGWRTVEVTAEPAPYCMPPVNLFGQKVVLLPPGQVEPMGADAVLVRAVDAAPRGAPPPGYVRWGRDEPVLLRPFPSRISWAAKPFEILVPRRTLRGPDGAAPAQTAPSPARDSP